MITGVVLSTLLIAIIPTIRLVRLQMRQSDHRVLAMSEVSNAMEMLRGAKIEDLAASSFNRPELSKLAREQLPEPQLDIEVSRIDEELEGVRIRVELTYVDQWGKRVKPVRLVAWRFEKGAGS